MEYASKICDGDLCDSNFMRYVGWQESSPCVREFFSQKTVNLISRKVSELTMGVDAQNRKIVVPDKTICGIMDNVYSSFRPPTGDIFTRYIIPSGMTPEDYVAQMIQQVIQILVSDVTVNLGIEENNRKLTVWTTLMGDFNQHGLRAHAPIKVLNKRPNAFQFNMNY